MKKLGMMLVLALLALGFNQEKAAASTIFDQTVLADNSQVYGGPLLFTLAVASDVTFAINKASPSTGKFNFVAAICSLATPNCQPVLLSSTPPGAIGSNTATGGFLASLGAGSYYLNLLYEAASGAASKIHYTFTADTAVTPIPGALVMFVTGLGFLGFAGYRRRGTSA